MTEKSLLENAGDLLEGGRAFVAGEGVGGRLSTIYPDYLIPRYPLMSASIAFCPCWKADGNLSSAATEFRMFGLTQPIASRTSS